MIDIKDTTSIFQLAFGLNAVIIVLLKNSYQKRKEFLDYIISEIRKYDTNLITENKNLYKNILKCYPFYKKFKYLFFSIILISSFSILCSFYYLNKAVLEPDSQMCKDSFIFLSILLVIVNPIIYYVYELILNLSISVIKDKLKISNEKAIYISTLINIMKRYEEQSNELSKLNFKVNKNFYRNKSRRLKRILATHPFLHPIKWYKDREMKIFINQILEEEKPS